MPSVLITGASSGIGLATAHLLDSKGYKVFAGVHRAESIDVLKNTLSARMEPLLLDITNQAHVDSAFDRISKETEKDDALIAIINNAGVALAGPVEFLPIEDVRDQLDVNVTGQLRIIQRFLPLLRRTKGRIIQVSSPEIYWALPFLGAYTCSKVAISSLTETLRRELLEWDVKVVQILPGFTKTEMWEKYKPKANSLEASLPKFASSQNTMFSAARRLFDWFGARGHSPQSVAQKILRALESRRPSRYYWIGIESRIWKLPLLIPPIFLDWILNRILKTATAGSNGRKR